MDTLTPDPIIVETTVWIDYFRDLSTPATDWLDQEIGHRRIGILDLILCEILQGLPRESEFQQVKKQFLDLEMHTSGGVQLALDSARHYRMLRAKGITVRKTIDCIIATYCIGQGLALLHNDRDFDPFEKHLGLRVVHPGSGSIQ